MKESKTKLRPIDTIKIYDPRGYAYLPAILRQEVGVEGKEEIPFFIDANVVLLVRKDASPEEIIRGLKVLMEDLKLRLGVEEEGETV